MRRNTTCTCIHPVTYQCLGRTRMPDNHIQAYNPMSHHHPQFSRSRRIGTSVHSRINSPLSLHGQSSPISSDESSTGTACPPSYHPRPRPSQSPPSSRHPKTSTTLGYDSHSFSTSEREPPRAVTWVFVRSRLAWVTTATHASNILADALAST